MKVYFDSYLIENLENATVDITGGFEADYFTVEFRYSDLEIFKKIWDAKGERVKIEIEGKEVFRGIIDVAEYHPFEGRIMIEGRDLTALLQDEILGNISEIQGKRSHEIVEILGKKVGLKVKAEKGEKVFGLSENKILGENETLWDIIKYFAMEEGFRAYVRRDTLYFGPAAQKKVRYRFKKGDFETLVFEQSKTLSLAVKVEVVGYDPEKKRKVIGRAESPLKNRPGTKTIRIREVGIKTKEQAEKRAKAILKDISNKMIRVRCSVKGFVDLDIDERVYIECGDIKGA